MPASKDPRQGVVTLQDAHEIMSFRTQKNPSEKDTYVPKANETSHLPAVALSFNQHHAISNLAVHIQTPIQT